MGNNIGYFDAVELVAVGVFVFVCASNSGEKVSAVFLDSDCIASRDWHMYLWFC